MCGDTEEDPDQENRQPNPRVFFGTELAPAVGPK